MEDLRSRERQLFTSPTISTSCLKSATNDGSAGRESGRREGESFLDHASLSGLIIGEESSLTGGRSEDTPTPGEEILRVEGLSRWGAFGVFPFPCGGGRSWGCRSPGKRKDGAAESPRRHRPRRRRRDLSQGKQCSFPFAGGSSRRRNCLPSRGEGKGGASQVFFHTGQSPSQQLRKRLRRQVHQLGKERGAGTAVFREVG